MRILTKRWTATRTLTITTRLQVIPWSLAVGRRQQAGFHPKYVLFYFVRLFFLIPTTTSSSPGQQLVHRPSIGPRSRSTLFKVPALSEVELYAQSTAMSATALCNHTNLGWVSRRLLPIRKDFQKKVKSKQMPSICDGINGNRRT